MAWGAFSLSFLNNLAPTQRLPVQTLVSHADQQVLGPGRSTSSPSAIFVLGSLTILAAAKATSRRSALIRRRAEEIEDWSLEFISKKYAPEVAKIRELCKELPEDYDDIKLMRYAMQHPGKPEDAAANVKEVLAWRQGEGAQLCEAAAKAIEKAQEGGGWDNAPVLAAAPYADKISKYITPSQMVVVSTKVGDLVTCIRASTIDSEALMKEVSEEEMTEFFIYAREVNSAIAELRTRAGHVCRLISANDLTGVSKFPDQAFQNALTGSAKKAVTLYPGYSGPTVLLNLPWLARMLVSVLTPLFPGAVRDKIKFARTPMDYMKDLKDVVKEPLRTNFADDIQAVMNT